MYNTLAKYPLREDFDVRSQANRLRTLLGAVRADPTITSDKSEGTMKYMMELLYTASETGIIDFRIDESDVLTLLRLHEIAKISYKLNLPIDEFRMQ